MKFVFVFCHLLFLYAFSIAGALPAWAGNGDGGGGSYCQSSEVNGGKPILLDLALKDGKIQDSIPSNRNNLHSSRVADRIGVDYQDMTHTDAYGEAIKLLKEWTKKSPASGARLEKALNEMIFGVTPRNLGPSERAVIPESSPCHGKSLSAIHYFDGVAVISISAWNALGTKSQVGLLIHEALRHVQIYEGMQGSDNDLQRLTAHILGDAPDPDLDQDAFFRIHPESAQMAQLKHDLCGALNSIAEIKAVGGLTRVQQDEKRRLCDDGADPKDIDEVRAFENELLNQSRCTGDPQALTSIAETYFFADQILSLMLQTVAKSHDRALTHMTEDLQLMSARRDRLVSNLRLYDLFLRNPNELTRQQRESLDTFEKHLGPLIEGTR